MLQCAKDAMSSDRISAAIGLRLLAMACVVGMGLLGKLAQTRGASLGEIIFFRQAASIPLTAAIAAVGPGLGSLRTRRLPAHAGRAAVGLSGMIALFTSLTLLPLAEATTLQFTVPIFATILGAILLGEPTGWHRWVAVLTGFAGVLIVAQPGGVHFPLGGALAGLSYGLITAVVSIQLRSIGKTEAPLTTVFWFATLSMVVLIPWYLLDHRGHAWPVWAMLLGLGVLGTAGQLSLTGSLKLAPVSVVVPMDYSSLVWAALLGWLVFGTVPGAWTLVGAPIIVGSGLYIVWREHVRRRTETDRLVD
jgi:drug/metabolite transporter (DMT)-like permease